MLEIRVDAYRIQLCCLVMYWLLVGARIGSIYSRLTTRYLAPGHPYCCYFYALWLLVFSVATAAAVLLQEEGVMLQW